MPSRHELVAHNRTPDAIAAAIGADLVIYQTLPDLINSVRQINPSIQQFDCSVFTGEYVTGGVDKGYLDKLERLRNDAAKGKPIEEAVPNGESGSGAETAGAYGGAKGEDDIKKRLKVAIEAGVRSSRQLNSADETVGLYNSWVRSAKESVISPS